MRGTEHVYTMVIGFGIAGTEAGDLQAGLSLDCASSRSPGLVHRGKDIF